MGDVIESGIHYHDWQHPEPAPGLECEPEFESAIREFCDCGAQRWIQVVKADAVHLLTAPRFTTN